MEFIENIQKLVAKCIEEHYDYELSPESVVVNTTKSDFDGEFTVVLFSFLKQLKTSPEQLGQIIGDYLKSNSDIIADYNIVKGFLNLSLPSEFWISTLREIKAKDNYGKQPSNGQKVLVEYSSPNTNKPLHLGHIRNILLGWSISNIYDAVGYEVIRTKIVNDRGVAICKSMLAWKKFGEGETPESAKMKGDFLVGKYYVLFDKKLKEEYNSWQQSSEANSLYEKHAKDDTDSQSFFKSYKNKYFNEYSDLGKEVKDMLIKWEANDPETRGLWSKMNAWVYNGFDTTYNSLGINFDSKYYESETYLTGKEIIEDGLVKQVFYQKEDGSIWVDLEDAGLDHKILLRADGTSVYLTQDLGTADIRYKDTAANKMIYVVGDEQDYHFKVLFEVMKKMGRSYADNLYHLSYGMVDLPTGKMKSREGTVVDADDLIAEVIAEARAGAKERGDLSELTEDQQEEVYRSIGLAALKFFMLKVTAKKRMVFDPKESVDMQGQTGPYIQNAYVRIKSIFRKSDETRNSDYGSYQILNQEKDIVRALVQYPQLIQQAADNYDPSIIANYSYSLAKLFHRFYHDVRILKAETPESKSFRLDLCETVADVLQSSFSLLGILMPERM